MRGGPPSFRDRSTRPGRRQRACHYTPSNRTEEGTVNPTARWPERLEHLASLPRADAMAVVSHSGPSTIFTYRISDPVDSLAALRAHRFDRAYAAPPLPPTAAAPLPPRSVVA